MLATIPSATLFGVDGRPVTVEVHVSNGLPGFTIVGLPDAACRESRDRVRAALMSSGGSWPLRRITVNLAPSSVRKGGAGLDLPIAVGLLVATGELEAEVVRGVAFIGELGLDGAIRRVHGMVPVVDAIETPTVVVPEACAHEAILVGRHVVRAAPTLADLVACLRGEQPWPDIDVPAPASELPQQRDLAEVRGQSFARKALEVAAAGGHHLLMLGPPGAGKTMLAERLPGLLPALVPSEAMEVTRAHSAAGENLAATPLMRRPPFRAPHHTSSVVSIVGGGSAAMRPGEIALAHRGVLFFDELGEFPNVVLDSLRQPLEEGVVRVSRAAGSVAYPARFLLVGAMNPCPCGDGITPGACRCSDASLARYGRRLSGPLLDRFDLRIVVTRPSVSELFDSEPGETSAVVRGRVHAARTRAAARGVATNAELAPSDLEACTSLSAAGQRLLGDRVERGELSPRGVRRVRAVARTLADLDGVDGIDDDHLALAVELRARPGLLRFSSGRCA